LKLKLLWQERWRLLLAGAWRLMVGALLLGLLALAIYVLTLKEQPWLAVMVALSGGLSWSLWLYWRERRQRLHLQQELLELERELNEVRKTAIAATRAKSAFLANMSHEFRTPLSIVIGYSELLAEDAENGLLQTEQTLNYLQRINSAARQLLALVNEILELTRLEAGDVVVNRGRWPIGLVIDEVKTAILPLASERNNQLMIELEVDPTTIVEIDRAKVRQILLHLLQNATRFTHQGEIRLTVTIHNNGKGPPLLQMKVSDTGEGMTGAQLDLIFEPFTRFEEQLTKRYSGVGIGLAIAQRLCQAMDGSIAVMSQPGKGTTFWVTIPLVKEQSPVAASL